MANETALAMLKADLGLLNPPASVAKYLAQLLEGAKAQIVARGVTLTESTEDLLFTASWAAWLYRKRDAGTGMPEMLLQELRTRLIRKATASQQEEEDP
jgi:hypothetical protein